MMNPTSKNPCKLPAATVITGKWHKQKYILLKELGQGANGIVYLTRYGNKKAALKISSNGLTITSEVNVLKSFAKAQGTALGPSLLDVDDWQGPDGLLCFYVMEYIEGPGLEAFLTNHGRDWLKVIFLQLLSDLEQLHRNGWVFGDLKPENLLISGPPYRIRCVDVGGTTLKGRAIKEYTEFFDRGFWGMGSRKAEPSYDLFSAAMILIATAYPVRFGRIEGGIKQLQSAILQKPELKKYEHVLLKALKGEYLTAMEMRMDFLNSESREHIRDCDISRVRMNHQAPQKDYQSSNLTRQKLGQYNRNGAKAPKKQGGMKETTLIGSAFGLLYIVYILVQLIN